MSIRTMFVLAMALFVQVCTASVDSQQVAKHTSNMKHQLKTKINPNGLIPMAPNPHPTGNTSISATGFIFLTNSYNPDCSYPFLTYGVPVGQCIVEDSYAYVFNVVQDSCDGGTIQYFLDTKCTIPTGNTDLETGTNQCSIAANPIVNAGGRNIYTSLSCTSSADIPRPSDSGAVVMTEHVNTTTCSTNADYVYLAYSNDVCIQIDNATFVPGCVDGLPYFNIPEDPQPNCSGVLVPMALSESCEVDAGQPEGDDEVYTPWFINPPPTISTTPFPTQQYVQANGSRVFSCQASLVPSVEPTAAPSTEPSAPPTRLPTSPSAIPTASPSNPTATPTVGLTAVPTMRPTFAKTGYPTASTVSTSTFAATQTINGISFTTYNTNVGLYSSTLISSIAASMQDVPTTAITNFVATAASDAPHAVHRPSALRRLQSTTAITTTYTVVTDSVYTAEQLAAQLSNSITSGTFDNTMHTTAANNGATALTTASSGEVTVTYPQSSGSSSSDKLSDGAIAGIVIGCVAGVILIAALLYYCVGGGKQAMSSHPQVEL